MTDRFAIIMCPDGTPVPVEALCVGPLDEMFGYIQQSVAREEHEQRLAVAEQQNMEVAQKLLDAMAHFTNCLGAEEASRADQARRDAKRDAKRAKRDQEEAKRQEQEQNERMIDQLPDPDDPDWHHNTGDLHDLPPSEDADQGDLPNELKKGAPPLTGTDTAPDFDKLAHPQSGTKQIAQPVSISLNAED